VDLHACERCGDWFAPEPQIAKVGLAIDADYLSFCPKCRKTNHAEVFFKLSPWRNKSDTLRKTACQ
jgi:hypothetical protein